MRAAVVKEFGPILSHRLDSLPDPTPGPGEVLVAIKAAAVNFVDSLVVTGKYQFLPERPFAPENLRDALRAQVFTSNNGNGVDIVLDPVGGDAFEAALRALAWRGRLVVIGFAAGRIPSVQANYLLVKNIEVSGLQVSDYRKRTPKLMAQCMGEIFALFEAGKLKPAPTVTRPLDDFAQALQDVVDRRVAGRVVLVPNP